MAHSKKYSQRCVAGVRLDTGEWIRPISKEVHGELPPRQVHFPNGGDMKNFDVVSACLEAHCPVKKQPENWRIQCSPWSLVCRPCPKEHAPLLKKVLYRGCVLFGNTLDRVAYREFDGAPAKASLLLAKPVHPRWIAKRTPGWKKQLRVRFHLDAVPYDLAVTDIPYDDMLKDLPLGEYSSAQLGIQNENELYFTISLGEPLDNGYCFKLVAAVLQPPDGWPSLE